MHEFELRVGEVVMIDDIQLVVVSIEEEYRARLGITAPKHVPVHRKEVYLKILRQKPAADRAEQDNSKEPQ